MACDWLFIDGSSLIFRAFYGVPRSVTSPDGKLINAGRGFLETLTRLLGTRDPRQLGALVRAAEGACDGDAASGEVATAA